MSELTLSQVYLRTVEILDQRGWTKGVYVDEQGCLCIGGAIGQALGATPLHIGDDDELGMAWTGMTVDIAERWDDIVGHLIDATGGLGMWNHAPERTYDEVRALLLRLAEEAERRG